jgi:hypothetical protein
VKNAVFEDPRGRFGIAPDASQRERAGPFGGTRLGIEIRRATAVEEIQENLRTSGPIGVAVLHGATVLRPFGSPVSALRFQPLLIETDEQESSNAASFALTMPLELGSASERRVVVDIEVEASAIGRNVIRITFPIAVVHTSRAWERCTQDFLSATRQAGQSSAV